MNYNYNRNEDGLNNEPINEIPKNKKWFTIHIVIGLILILVYVGMMNTDWINSFLVFEKIDVIKKIYFVGVIIYIIFAIMSQKEDDLHSKKFKDTIIDGIKLMVWWAIVIGALFILSLYYMFFPSKGMGLKDEIEINGILIPTLYKYTKNDDVFTTANFQNVPGEEKMNFVAVTYNNPISIDELNTYKSILDNLGYKIETIQGVEMYLCNFPEKLSYICIIISDDNISYGVVTYEEYQMMLDGTWMTGELIEENNF